MVGPVDFGKTVEYWQQDRWTGCFAVKWHVIKDIPNSVLRHITLENNENRPVTNSRDTQEVFAVPCFIIYAMNSTSFSTKIHIYIYISFCRLSLRRVLRLSKFSRSIQAKHASWMILGFMRLAKRQLRKENLRNSSLRNR